MTGLVRPLSGKTIVITRPREDAAELLGGVERLGGRAILCPTIRIEFVDPGLLEARIGGLGFYPWIVFTSANAVRALEWLFQGRAYAGTLAAVGRRTAREAERLGLRIAVQPEESTGAALADVLVERIAPGQRVLLPQSDVARREVSERLGQAGIEVCVVEAYRTVFEDRDAARELREYLRGAVPDAVLFASPSAVKGVSRVLSEEEAHVVLGAAALFSIGPSTTDQVRSLGHEVAGEAEPHDASGLLAAVARHFEGR